MNKEDVLEVCKGNELAARFLLSFLAFCHLVDDVQDKDKVVTKERLITENLWLIEELGLNPWVRDNIGMLWPLIVTGCNAWLDSEDWKNSGNKSLQAQADVVKSSYQEVVFFTAYICGGREHMHNMSKKFRQYNIEQKD